MAWHGTHPVRCRNPTPTERRSSLRLSDKR
jgi:hypothetical protein